MQIAALMKSVVRTDGKRARGLACSILFLFGSVALTGCDRNAPPALQESRITPVNYDKISLKMSQEQVKDILGPPSSAKTDDMVIFKKTTFRYEEGDKFIVLTFKNDELDSKDGNLETK